MNFRINYIKALIMMKKLILFFLIGLSTNVFCQYNGRHFSLNTGINYTTSARIFLNPNSPDFDLRSRVFSLSEIFSPSIELRYGITKDIFLGISTEYIKKTDLGNNLTVITQSGQRRIITVEDGFKVIPVELFVYYLLPFSTENFKMLMGGGAAYYYGEQIRKFGDEDVSNLSRKFAYGIQVSVSTDYMINNFLSVRGEMKFRDPEIEVTSRYNKKSIEYFGQRIVFNNDKFDTKININGVTFLFGFAAHF